MFYRYILFGCDIWTQSSIIRKSVLQRKKFNYVHACQYIKWFLIFHIILMKNKQDGDVSLCSGIWEHTIYFQLYSKLCLKWKLSAHILGNVEKIPTFQSPTTSSYRICHSLPHRKALHTAANFRTFSIRGSA